MILPAFNLRLGILIPIATILIAVETLMFCALHIYSRDVNLIRSTYANEVRIRERRTTHQATRAVTAVGHGRRPPTTPTRFAADEG